METCGIEFNYLYKSVCMQRDGDSCGPYICAFAIALAVKFDISQDTFKSFDLVRFRQMIFNDITMFVEVHENTAMYPCSCMDYLLPVLFSNVRDMASHSYETSIPVNMEVETSVEKQELKLKKTSKAPRLQNTSKIVPVHHYGTRASRNVKIDLPSSLREFVLID